MKRKYIIVGIVFLTLVGLAMFLFMKFRQPKKEYLYKMVYHDDAIPGTQYDIYISEEYNIYVEEQPLCSTTDCMNGALPKKEKYTPNFSAENKENVKRFIQEYFSKIEEKEVELYPRNLSEKEQSMIMAILTGNQIYFDAIDERKLFEISSNRLDCETVTLLVYSDNRYKYIYGYDSTTEEWKFKQGTYAYSMDKFMQSLKEPAIPDHLGPYYLWDREGKRYTLYDTNKEFKSFLESIHLDLDVCMENR